MTARAALIPKFMVKNLHSIIANNKPRSMQWWDLKISLQANSLPIKLGLLHGGHIAQWIALSFCTQRPRLRLSSLLILIDGTD